MTINPGVGFTTKETADNPHTKAALKVKGNIVIFINDDGEQEATVS